MQLENLRLERNIENNDKPRDERYQKILNNKKYHDEMDQISKIDEETIIEDIEALKMQK